MHTPESLVMQFSNAARAHFPCNYQEPLTLVWWAANTHTHVTCVSVLLARDPHQSFVNDATHIIYTHTQTRSPICVCHNQQTPI